MSVFGSRRPYKLVTVSLYADKATLMVRRLAETLRDSYIVIHAANCERVEEVAFRVRDLQPDLLVWTSSWTEAEVESIRKIARALDANLEMFGLPEVVPGDISAEMILARFGTKVPRIADDASDSGDTRSASAPIPVK